MWWLPALIIFSSLFFHGSTNLIADSSTTPTIKVDSISPVKETPSPIVSERNFGVPTRLIIPSIGLDTPVAIVGLNEKQLVDVPTNIPGWYNGGVIPGEKGNATMQGHVTAIFGNLNKLKEGDDLYVDDRHFVVVETELINKGDFDVKKVYGATDKRRLNLITCAGKIVNGDFDKRTIVYSELVTP